MTQWDVVTAETEDYELPKQGEIKCGKTPVLCSGDAVFDHGWCRYARFWLWHVSSFQLSADLDCDTVWGIQTSCFWLSLTLHLTFWPDMTDIISLGPDFLLVYLCHLTKLLFDLEHRQKQKGGDVRVLGHKIVDDTSTSLPL